MVCLRRISFLLPLCFLLSVVAASSQLQPEPSDPLARIRDAAKNNVQACSATGETLCEQVAPKIIANAEGDSPLEDNVRRLAQQIHERKIGSSGDGANWAIAAFQAAGMEAHKEENSVPREGLEATLRMREVVAAAYRAAGLETYAGEDKRAAAGTGGVSRLQRVVVAELRGRGKPEEWVLLGARLQLDSLDTTTVASSAALVIEAARDIQLTGVRPRRSIRFVLLIDEDWSMLGSWAYVRAHRNELDRARAALFFEGGANRVTTYTTGGRTDIETGLREATKPIESWGVGYGTPGASVSTEEFDFLLEGVPAMVAEQGQRYSTLIPKMQSPGPIPDFSETLDKVDIQQLKLNSAIAAVTAFGIAERSEPLGPRQSRSEIESLLEATGLAEQMKISGLWSLWESGQRGRLP